MCWWVGEEAYLVLVFIVVGEIVDVQEVVLGSVAHARLLVLSLECVLTPLIRV